MAPTLDPDQWEAGADPGDPCREGGRGARAVAYSGSDLLKATFPPRPALLYRAGTPVLRAGNLVELVGQRGRGKSWVMLSLALLTACGGEVLGFSCADPLRVLYVDGEMESELVQQRLDLLAGPHGALDLRGDLSRLRYIAADWQADFLPRLDTPEGQAYIEYEVERADVVFLDNRSCLFDPNGEKDPEAWQPAQEYLLSLRRRGKAVVVAHHTNKQGGARGHSKAEDPLMLCGSSTRQPTTSRRRVAASSFRGRNPAPSLGLLSSLSSPGLRMTKDGSWSRKRRRSSVGRRSTT